MSFVPSDKHFIQSCSFRLGMSSAPRTVMSLELKPTTCYNLFKCSRGKQVCFNGSKVLIFTKSLQRHTQLLLQCLWESAVWLRVITRMTELMSSNTLHIFYSFTKNILLKQHILQCSQFGKVSTVSSVGFSLIRWARKMHGHSLINKQLKMAWFKTGIEIWA